MTELANQSVHATLIENDVTVANSFADGCVGISIHNGNLHITLFSVVVDHTKTPAVFRGTVSHRVVMPIKGAIELRDTLTRMIDLVGAPGSAVPPLSTPSATTPARPH